MDVLLAPEQAPYLEHDKPYERKQLIGADNDTITSVVPGDYDGDAQMDLLVTKVNKSGQERKVKVYIYYGKTKTVTVGKQVMHKITFV